jgi:hypothetical protein
MLASVTTETLTIDKSRGFTFCNNKIPVSEYHNGLSIGGTSGEKNNTSDSMTNCSTIIFGRINGFLTRYLKNKVNQCFR